MNTNIFETDTNPLYTYKILNINKFCFILVAVICFGKSVNAQVECDLKISSFLIEIENSENSIELSGIYGFHGGTAFSLKEGQKLEFHDQGMIFFTNDKVDKDDEQLFE